MAQWLKALAILVEDLGLTPRAHTHGGSQPLEILVSGDLMSSSDPCRQHGTQAKHS